MYKLKGKKTRQIARLPDSSVTERIINIESDAFIMRSQTRSCQHKFKVKLK